MKKQKIKQKTQLNKLLVNEILDKRDINEVRALFAFNQSHSDEEVLLKFQLWSRYFFFNYFKCKDAPFHKEIDLGNLNAYRGDLKYFIDIAFRGASKTSRTKLFIAFAIANDEDHYRKYIKVLSKDLKNSRQITTDIYNMFIQERVRNFYPEIFQKSALKREETMASFTTSFGVKITAGTVGMEQRGNLQDDARPDLILFEDIETRNTLRSAVETNTIFQNMEEARTGLAREGSAIYNANYLSERGNVHKLVTWEAIDKRVLITPIYTRENGIAWPDAYTLDDIKKIKAEADDFAGEYLCQPSLGADTYFDRDSLNKQQAREILKEIADFKIFHKFDPSHRYGGGMDVSGGVGLDSSTAVYIDFSTMPNRVIATYKSNTIKPDIFGDEIARQAEMYGEPLVAPENNNHGHATIGRLKQLYSNIFTMEQLTDTAEITPKKSRTYGWSTNRLTKNDMMMDLRKAVEDGHLELSDIDLINEMKSYTRGDLMDAEVDPRLATRHFDLLIACAIAWKMRHFATPKRTFREDSYSTEITEKELEVY